MLATHDHRADFPCNGRHIIRAADAGADSRAAVHIQPEKPSR
jgi:hypothetical protein